MSGDLEFELDLTSYEMPAERPSGRDAGSSDDGEGRVVVPDEERLERLLAPFSPESRQKAWKLLQSGQVEMTKAEETPGSALSWYNVAGSRLYVVKLTRGEDYLFAECSCPNGMHRGGDATCYHSIAARVLEAGLAAEFEGWF